MQVWRGSRRGRSYSGFDDRSPDARGAGPRALAGCGRGGDRRVAASALGASSSGAAPSLHAGRSDAAGLAGEAAAPPTVGVVLGGALDIAALAPGTGRPPMDLRRTRTSQRGLDPAIIEVVLRLAGENPRWGMCGSSANAAPWASRCLPRRCDASFADTDWARHRDGPARPGLISCALKPAGCWRVTSASRQLGRLGGP
jgi:hypothetical protein